MGVRLELAQIVGDAMMKDNLLSVRDAGISAFKVDAIPCPLEVRMVAQLAFTEPDMDQPYKYNLGIVDSAKSPLVSVKGEALPTRPPGADRVFPFVFTVIERLEFEVPMAGYYAGVVVLNNKPLRYMPFKVSTGVG